MKIFFPSKCSVPENFTVNMKNLFSRGKLLLLLWFATIQTTNCSSIFPVQEPLLKELQAECTGDGIKVNLWFKKPFGGVAYSNGHYETATCRYIVHQQDPIVRSGTNFSFVIPMHGCGTVYHGGYGSTVKPMEKNNENEVYIENTLLIQNDPTIQEAGDVAKTLRCVWQKQIHQPLMASLPIAGGKMTVPKIRANAERVQTVMAAKMQKNSPRSPQVSQQGQVHFRFQKKGHVKSVPVNERHQHSRALGFSDEDDTSTQEVDHDEEETSTEYTRVLLQDHNTHDALPLNAVSSSTSSVKSTHLMTMILSIALMSVLKIP